MSTIKFSPKEYNDAELVNKAKKVKSDLTNNPHFLTPFPSVDTLGTLTNELEDAIVKALDGSKTALLLRDQKRKDLEETLKQLKLFVELNGKGDPVILSGSGFDLIASERRTFGVLEKPEAVKVTPQIAGAKIKVSRVEGASAYCYEFSPAPVSEESKWDNHLSSSGSIVVNGLKSGQQYAFRVSAIGKQPTRVYSDIVTSFIL